MRKILSILMVLALMTALFVSCSQDNVGNAVTNDLVSVSFTTGGSRALTVSRETFDENNYVWYYKAQKADSTGLTTGAQSTWTPVKPLTETPRTGLSGAIIDGISQGLWNFELQAYAYGSQDPQDKDYPTTGVAVWNGKVTNQPVKKGEANIVNVTVSAIATGDGTINWSGISGMKDLGGVIKNLQEIIFVDPDAELKVPTGMKVYISATAFGETEPEDGMFITIDENNIEDVTGLFEDVEAGTYLFNAMVFSGASVDAADFVYADETIAINVYSVLQTIIKGYISELSSYVEFGEPVANAVIEASTESVIDTEEGDDPVEFNTDSTQSTSYQAASIPAAAVATIRDEVVVVPTGSTLTDLALALNVEDRGSTDASATTTKKFEISLDAIVTTTDGSSGAVNVDTQSVDELEDIMVIALYIGKNLTLQEVWHDDTQLYTTAGDDGEFYSYDSYDGILTLNVNHFSPFSVIYGKEVAVARLIKADGTGSDFYTLPEAVDAANDGDTIRLLTDLDFSQEPYSDYKWGSTYQPLEITNNDITLDLNGKTIENMGNCALVFGHILAVDGRISNVTIKNGTLKAGKTSGVTNSYVLGIAGADGALIENVTTDGGINVYSLSQDVVIKNCTVNGTKYYTVCAQTGSEVTIEGDDGAFSKNTDSTVATKAMFWVDKAGKDSDVATPENPEGNYGASSITIKAGTFKIDTENGGVFYLSSGLKPVARGGIYNINPSAYAPADCLVEEIGDGWYKVTPLTLVEAVDSSCIATGKHTYWTDGTNNYIINGSTISPVTDAELVIPVHEHALVYKSYTDNGDGTCDVTLECVRCGNEVTREGIDLYILSNPSLSTTHSFKVKKGNNVISDALPFYDCLKLGGVVVLPTNDPNATYYINNNSDNINYTSGTFRDLYVVGCGQKISVVGTSMANKGLRIWNRKASMVESGTFTNVYFANVTLGAWSTASGNPMYPLFITSYNVEVGFTNVKFGGAEGKDSLQAWLLETYDPESDGYPTKQYNSATYLNFKNCTVDEGYSFKFAFQGMKAEQNYYASIHMYADASSISTLKLDGAGLIVSTAVQHDGIHNEWFLNGKIRRGVAGSKGIYSVN